MNILIIEDEAIAARNLVRIIKDVIPDYRSVGQLESVDQSVQWLTSNPSPDVILLDIQLSDGSSFEIFSKTQVTAPVIFITAYDEYALQAFKVNSIDYLLKPIDKQEFRRSIEKLRTFSELRSAPNLSHMTQLLNSLKDVAASIYKTRFLVKTGQTFVTIFTQDIAYFIAENKVSFLVTNAGKKHIVDQTLEELEDQLNPKLFFRLNRQCIAAVHSIAKLHNYFNRKLKVELNPPTDIEVLVSREKSAEFKKWLDQ